MVEYKYREKPKIFPRRTETDPTVPLSPSRRRLIPGAALFVVRTKSKRKNDKKGQQPIADQFGAPARLSNAGHRPITHPATAKQRERRPEWQAGAYCTQRTRQRRTAGTRRAYGCTAAKSRTRSRPLFGQAMRPQARGTTTKPLKATVLNRREPCRQTDGWGGRNGAAHARGRDRPAAMPSRRDGGNSRAAG